MFPRIISHLNELHNNFASNCVTNPCSLILLTKKSFKVKFNFDNSFFPVPRSIEMIKFRLVKVFFPRVLRLCLRRYAD